MSSSASHGSDAQGTVKSYIIGFLLCIFLTIVPFGVVMAGTFSKLAVILIVVFAAILQIYVQLYCFMHMDTSPEQRWNLVAFAFSLVIIFVVVGGSVWIMHSLDYFMM